MKKVKNNFNSLHLQVNTLTGSTDLATLDALYLTLSALQAEPLSVFEQRALEDIEHTLISAYRKREEAWVQHQLSEITDLAQRAASKEEIAQLNQKINCLMEDYRPSVEERRILAETRRLIAGTPLMTDLCPMEIQEGQFEEILEIARALYEGRLTEAKRGYNQLPYEIKQMIQGHMDHLNGVLFVDYWETLKALFATTNALVGNGELYPSEALIEDVFMELKAIDADQEALSLGA